MAAVRAGPVGPGAAGRRAGRAAAGPFPAVGRAGDRPGTGAGRPGGRDLEPARGGAAGRHRRPAGSTRDAGPRTVSSALRNAAPGGRPVRRPGARTAPTGRDGGRGGRPGTAGGPGHRRGGPRQVGAPGQARRGPGARRLAGGGRTLPRVRGHPAGLALDRGAPWRGRRLAAPTGTGRRPGPVALRTGGGRGLGRRRRGTVPAAPGGLVLARPGCPGPAARDRAGRPAPGGHRDARPADRRR